MKACAVGGRREKSLLSDPGSEIPLQREKEKGQARRLYELEGMIKNKQNTQIGRKELPTS